MGVNGNPWIDIQVTSWITMDVNGFPVTSIHAIWTSMDNHGCQWKNLRLLGIHGHALMVTIARCGSEIVFITFHKGGLWGTGLGVGERAGGGVGGVVTREWGGEGLHFNFVWLFFWNKSPTEVPGASALSLFAFNQLSGTFFENKKPPEALGGWTQSFWRKSEVSET